MSNIQEQLNRDFKHAIISLEGHAKTSNKEVGLIQIDVKGIKTDVSWLKKFFLIIATSSVGALIAGVINLLIK